MNPVALTRRGASGVCRWIRRPVHPDRPRWSWTKTLNIVCGTTLAWMLIWTFIGSNWKLGVEGQVVGCLPWRYFVLTTKAPETIVRGKIYQYKSEGIRLIPNGTAIAKYAAGVPGDRVTVNAKGIFINDKYWGPLNPRVLKKGHLTVEQVSKSYVIPAGKVLMLGTVDVTWDGRYWGLINAMQINATAYPLW